MCLTAGPMLADVLWSVNILPPLRRALPEAHLAWECPTLETWPWLRLYPELDEVVGDVEEMSIAPDAYLILHPFWQDKDAPVAGLFKVIGDWCPPPENLPSLAHWRSFRLLREHQPWKLVLIFALTMITGLGAGFSIVLLIPLLQLLDVGINEEEIGRAHV